MKRLIRIILCTAALCIVAASAMYASFYYLSNRSGNKMSLGSFTLHTVEEPDITVERLITEETGSEEAVRITKNAKIAYEYSYPDGITKRDEEEVPYFLIGVTEDELTEIYYGWDIAGFSQDSVVLRKQLKQEGESYIVGVKDGFVAVFYNSAQKTDNIKEVTSTPVNALTPDEQLKLKEGIYVSGRDNLNKILEDYGS